MTEALADTVWRHGRLDAHAGATKVVFGRMYEDASIEREAFPRGSRVLCIASAGCTAMALARDHEVVAIDINPTQLAYARDRCAGAPRRDGSAERILAFGRRVAPVVGWTRKHVSTFLAQSDPVEQLAYWRQHLDTWRFRKAADTFLAIAALRTVYAPQLVALLPPHLGAVMRARMERCFALHANCDNPYARALLTGESSEVATPAACWESIRFVCNDAASFLEKAPARSFDGFALSNILDGATPAYGERLRAAVQRAAAPGATIVLRSFREPASAIATNRAAADRSMLWGIVDVAPATSFNQHENQGRSA